VLAVAPALALAAPLVAATPQSDVDSLVLVFAASAVAAIVSRYHRRIVLPSVVLELVLGMLIGPEVLDIAQVDRFLAYLANFGLVLLFFFAGIEVVEKRVPRRSLVRGSIGWGLSLALAAILGAVLEGAGLDIEFWLLAVALSTTALGTLVPVLSDAGLLPTRLGTATLGTGVAGEFWPIVVISVFLTGVYGAAEELLLLLGFGVVVAAAAATALRARPPRVVRVLQETIHTTGQAAVRLSLLVLAALVLLANDVGFDFVLGAFAAGLVVGLALDSPPGEVVRMRLEGIAFGFLIPIYFVVTGMNFDLTSLLSAEGLALAALFLGLLLVTRGASSFLWLRELAARERLALALFGATGLPLIVAIVDIADDRGAVGGDVGTSLIGAGMLSVLVYPLLGTAIAARGRAPAAAPAAVPGGEA
jgi:Kef-type K+ transport system membrane component KefB